MKSGGSKAKGSDFERIICKRLSLWMSRGFRDDLFWRSAMSGGRATVKFKRGGRGQSQIGDVTAIDSQGERLTNHFLIECKFYRDLQLERLFRPVKGNILDFWMRCQTDAAKYRRHPMLIAKQNASSIYICLDSRGAPLLIPGEGFRFPDFVQATGAERGIGKKPFLYLARFPALDFNVYDFETFLKVANRP